jgi:hypothetical protein
MLVWRIDEPCVRDSRVCIAVPIHAYIDFSPPNSDKAGPSMPGTKRRPSLGSAPGDSNDHDRT